MKKGMIFLRVCVLLALVLPWSLTTAGAAGEAVTVTEGAFTAEIAEGVATVTAWDPGGFTESVTVPGTIGGYPVRRIGPRAFSGEALSQLTLPEGLEEIGEGAFAYNGGTLASLRLPESLKTIGREAFMGSNLTGTVRIPASVESIGEYAFSYNRVREFRVDGDNPSYCSEDGVLFDKAKTILYNYPTARTDSAYTVPRSVGLLYCTSFARAGNLRELYVPSPDASLRGMMYTFVDDELDVWCRTGSRLYTQLGSGYFQQAVRLTPKELPALSVDCTETGGGTLSVDLKGDFIGETCFLGLYAGTGRLLSLRAVDSGWTVAAYTFSGVPSSAKLLLFQLDGSLRPAAARELLWSR